MVGGGAARRQRGSRGAGFAGWRCGAGRRRTDSEISIGAHISILRAGGGAISSAMRAVVAVTRNSMLALDVEDELSWNMASLWRLKTNLSGGCKADVAARAANN